MYCEKWSVKGLPSRAITHSSFEIESDIGITLQEKAFWRDQQVSACRNAFGGGKSYLNGFAFAVEYLFGCDTP